jgi:hypothetical protein
VSENYTQKQAKKMARWKPGHSGNLSGRPRGSLNKSTREIKEILADLVSFDVVVRKLFDRAAKGNERAAELLLAYRFGKPSGRDELLIQERQVGDMDLERLAEAALKRLTTGELVEHLEEKLKLSNLGVNPASTVT